MRPLLALPLLLAFLAGCSDAGGDDDGGLVENACTQHPNYGTGNPLVTLYTTHGNLTAEIFVDKAPNTGMNFVKLAEAGTLNNTKFHRIITNFMMQGGDHTLGNGQGGRAHPDCDTGDGDILDEFRADLRHTGKGTLSMANAGPDSASSQFFVTFVKTDWLDAYGTDGQLKDCGAIDPRTGYPISCHAVFGQVVSGMETLDRVNSQAASSGGTPRVPVTLLNATVEWPAGA